MKDDDSKMAASAICFAADMVKAAWQEAAAILAALAEERDAAEAEAAALREALHDAIRRPMGVVPASAEPFYSVAEAEAAEARRIALKENHDGL